MNNCDYMKEELPEVSLVIVAAGASSRMKAYKRKPWLSLGGKAVIYHTLEAFKGLDEIREIVLVVNKDDEKYVREVEWTQLKKHGVSLITTGGESRYESVWNGITITDTMNDVVAVHDAVRPFLKQDMLKGLFKMARDYGAAIPAVPMQDSLKRVEGDKIIESISRVGAMLAQTPQCFRRDLLIESFEYARNTGGIPETITDEAGLVENYGQKVSVLLGSSFNIKLTTQEDLVIGDMLLKSGLLER